MFCVLCKFVSEALYDAAVGGVTDFKEDGLFLLWCWELLWTQCLVGDLGK